MDNIQDLSECPAPQEQADEEDDVPVPVSTPKKQKFTEETSVTLKTLGKQINEAETRLSRWKEEWDSERHLREAYGTPKEYVSQLNRQLNDLRAIKILHLKGALASKSGMNSSLLPSACSKYCSHIPKGISN